MDIEKLREILLKIPLVPILLVYLGYLAYDYYTYTADAESPYVQKLSLVNTKRNDNLKVEQDLKKAEEFFSTLEAKRKSVIELVNQLNDMKVALAEELDIPSFIKMVVTESKKIGLELRSFHPGAESRQEYYTEQVFDVQYRGVYAQVLVFLDRISSLQRIVRVDTVDMAPQRRVRGGFTELAGTMQLKTYKYSGSKADQIGVDIKSAPPPWEAARKKAAAALPKPKTEAPATPAEKGN